MAASNAGGSELLLGLERNARNHPTGRVYCECCDAVGERPDEVSHMVDCPLADD
ncbi:hypothetical protein SAMN06269185_3305 [Natronoarchaeum philippinense]|uniref:Uncharacterized protein n=1 Tax=Natronoarchaeum philippinense TaxID=558529 RepID=A0A285P920_NATPI|nr:hypothetical protein SAMN06269185_3305 [Natronoarchaeum philippinense]